MIYKLQNGRTIPLGGDYLEYLQSIPETYGGSIQPSIKVESLPKKFNGSQQAARTYAEGYQKGAKPVTKAIDNAGQKIFNTTKNVAMFVPGPTGAITWLGQMGADTANGEYSKVAKDLGAAVLIGAGLKGAQVGAKAAGRAMAGKGVNIPWLDAYDYSALRNEYLNRSVSKIKNLDINTMYSLSSDLLRSELTDPTQLVHVSPNNLSESRYVSNASAAKVGKAVETMASHTDGYNWVPGNSYVSNINGNNKVWLFRGKPYRLNTGDNTFLSIDENLLPYIETTQNGAVGVNKIPLDKATKIFQRNPITGGIEKVKYQFPKQIRVVSEGTYPLYTGSKHSITEVVNPDGTVNPRAALRIEREIADNIPGAYRMESRLENPEWHINDPNTWIHTRNVAQSAWTVPTPKGLTKQDQMVAALGHDLGKIVSGDGHAKSSAALIEQIFPDITAQQLEAISEHMGTPKSILGKVTKQADILNGKSAITRFVGDNGKIRLRLPSHTVEKPRELVLDPQGNNKFRVHTRTWDGDHIPAEMSVEDKNTLFNALYEELPQGAEILFPESGPGNYATRGTVAGLQRLARDSRFKPTGNGVLQYVDKDGSIKTFEGTGFRKPKSIKLVSRPITEAERLGIPKGERSSPKALEDPQYWGYRQWNDRYNAAISAGNVPEIQRLRALHFITKAPNTKIIEATGMPKEVYHGSVGEKFTVFDSSKTRPDYDYGTSTNMFSDNKNVGLGYANNDPDKLHSVYLNLQNILERDFKGNPWNGSVNNSGKFQIVPEYGTTYSSKQEAEIALQKMLDQYYPNNPAKQAEQRHYMYVIELMDPPHPERSTNAFSDEIANIPTLDGGIVKNVKDYYDLPRFDENPELYNELTTPHTDYFVKDPRNIKSSAIITHDDFGRIIPIVKRDNFHNPDLRYKHGGKI